MKKYITLAALLAAGSLAANAALDMSYSACKTALDEALKASNYTAGTDFTLKFAVAESNFDAYKSGAILKVSDSIFLFSQAGTYLGISPNGSSVNGDLEDNTLTDGAGKEVADPKSGDTLASHVNYKGASTNGWFIGAAGIVTKTDLTLTYSSSAKNLVFAFTYTNEASTYEQNITLTGIETLDISEMDFGGFCYSGTPATVTTTWSVASLKEGSSIVIGGKSYAIPEPSAFGLLAGLGALALVGTRRRRK